MINPSRVAFTIFGREIYWYGVLIAVSVVLAIVLAMREAKRRRFNPDLLLDFALLAIPLGVVGARLYYVVFEWSQFANDPVRILYIWEGGLAIYGVIIGGVFAALIFCKWRKVRFWTLADLIAPGLVLGQAIGRWGNFFNQEAYGPLVTDPNWMWFPFAVRIDATNTIHMATFFYESIWCFAVFAFLMLRRRKFKYEGDVMLWYFMLYGVERMLVEGLRQDSLWLIPGAVRVSQLLSLLLILAVIAFMILRDKRQKAGLATLGSMPLAALEIAADAPDGDEPENAVEDGEPAVTPDAEKPDAESAACECGCETDCDECEEECETVLSTEKEAVEDPLDE